MRAPIEVLARPLVDAFAAALAAALERHVARAVDAQRVLAGAGLAPTVSRPKRVRRPAPSIAVVDVEPPPHHQRRHHRRGGSRSRAS